MTVTVNLLSDAYAYIPFNSFHGRHVFRGWITAETHRLLTHSSELEIWKQEGAFFYHHLRARGYPRWHLAAVFERVTWARRTQILTGGPKGNDHEFFETYRACVLTLRNMAAAQGKTGSSTNEVDQVHLWGHFSSESLLSPKQSAQIGINPQTMITQQGWKAYLVRTSSWAEAGERRRSQEYGRLTIPGRPAWHQCGRARNCKAGFNKAQPSGRLPARTRAVRESPRSLAGRTDARP